MLYITNNGTAMVSVSELGLGWVLVSELELVSVSELELELALALALARFVQQQSRCSCVMSIYSDHKYQRFVFFYPYCPYTRKTHHCVPTARKKPN